MGAAKPGQVRPQLPNLTNTTDGELSINYLPTLSISVHPRRGAGWMVFRDLSMPRQGVAECAATAAVTTVRRSTVSNGLNIMRLSAAWASYHAHRVDDGG